MVHGACSFREAWEDDYTSTPGGLFEKRMKALVLLAQRAPASVGRPKVPIELDGKVLFKVQCW
jgi:hypothetical protein